MLEILKQGNYDGANGQALFELDLTTAQQEIDNVVDTLGTSYQDIDEIIDALKELKNEKLEVWINRLDEVAEAVSDAYNKLEEI